MVERKEIVSSVHELQFMGAEIIILKNFDCYLIHLPQVFGQPSEYFQNPTMQSMHNIWR